MNIKNNFFLFLILNICFYLLSLRYINLGFDKLQILYFTISSFISNCILFVGFKKFDTLLNPVSIYYPFLICFSYNFIILSDKQSTLSITGFLICFLSIVAYISTVLFPYKKVKLLRNVNYSLQNKVKRDIYLFILLIAFVTFCIETYLIGYLPLLNSSNRDVYSDSNSNMVPLLHYFIIICSFMPSWGFILLRQKIINKKFFILSTVLVLFILANYLSKQVYLLLAISAIYTYDFYFKLNVKKITITVVSIIVLFILTAQLRFSNVTNIDIDAYYRMQAGISNTNITFYEAAMTEYSSNRFGALERMINYFEKSDFIGLGIYTLKPIHSLFFLEKAGLVNKPPELDSESLVGTYVADPYFDFGFFGVIFLNIFYGYLAVKYYFRMKNGDVNSVVKFSFVSFCLIMGMFVNFFNSMLFLLAIVFTNLLISNRKLNVDKK